jgi:hypothetical protein
MFKQMQLTEKLKQIHQRTHTKVVLEKPNLKMDKSNGGKTSTPKNVESNSTFRIESQAKVIDEDSSSPKGSPIKVSLCYLFKHVEKSEFSTSTKVSKANFFYNFNRSNILRAV